MKLRSMFLPMVMIAGFHTSCTQSDSSDDDSDESSSETDKDSDCEAADDCVDTSSVVSGSLAIVTEETSSYSVSSQSNVQIVTTDGEIKPFVSTLQINGGASLKEAKNFVAEKTIVNQYDGSIFIVLTDDQPSGGFDDCSILRVVAGEKEMVCVAPKTNIFGFHDHNNNNFTDKTELFYVKFDGEGNAFFMAQTDSQRDNDESPQIYKIKASSSKPVSIAKESDVFIRGMDANAEGALFYWTEGKEGGEPTGTDIVQVFIIKPDGDKIELPAPNSSANTTKMLFFATDRFGGLMYCPEIDQMSEHHIYKLSFDSDYAITQTLNMTEQEEGGYSEISWPVMPMVDNKGRLFIRANKSSDTDDGAPHLYMYTVIKSGSKYSSTQEMISGESEVVGIFSIVGEEVFYSAHDGDESDMFFRKKTLGKDDSIDLEIDGVVTKLSPDSKGNMLSTFCDDDDDGDCSFAVVEPDASDVVVTDGLDGVKSMSATGAVAPKAL
jgi:hypothetical protein